MKKWGIVLGIIVALGIGVALAIAASNDRGDKAWTWRYKMTVAVETPEGIKTGSSVRQVDIQMKDIGWDEINKQPHYVHKHKVKGEAVVVDLGKRGVLFTLIDWTAYVDAMNAFGLGKYEDIAALPIGSKAEFKPEKYPGYPSFVTFENPQDPLSVKAVRKEYFSAVFGKGVVLKGITLEITDEPVTWNMVDKYLPINFTETITNNWHQLSFEERVRLQSITHFKQGEPK